jgi:hypothetical protein
MQNAEFGNTAGLAGQRGGENAECRMQNAE